MLSSYLLQQIRGHFFYIKLFPYFRYRYIAIKIVRNSARGIVIQTPVTPISFGRISMNKTTKIKERREEISAEIKPFPKAVKYPERNTFTPIKRKSRLNIFNPSHVNVNTFPSATNK